MNEGDINFEIQIIERGINQDYGLEQILYNIKFGDIFASFYEAQN